MSASIALRPPSEADAAAPPRSRPFTSVEIHADAGVILADWERLEGESACSIYQTRRWLRPWVDTLGSQAGIDPMFVVARDAGGRAVALLPLGVRRRCGLRVSGWLGGKDSNFALPLLRDGEAWTAGDATALLRRAGTLGRIDAFVLLNQPESWAGTQNPFAAFPCRPSPSAAYGTRLTAPADGFLAGKVSKEGRKKLRKKEAKLAAMGPISHLVAGDRAERDRVLDAFLAMRLARFERQGISSAFGTAAMRRFLQAASASSPPAIELHALLVGTRIVAVYGGAPQHGRWSGMVNAFDTAEDVAPCSPGDLLLHRVVAHCIEAGLTEFDLGIGEARYKAALCERAIRLRDALLPLTACGHVYTAAVVVALAAKHTIKSNPRLFAAARRWRRI